MDLSNYITDDITTSNTGGLRPKPVYLCVLFYDFPSFLTIALVFLNMQIAIMFHLVPTLTTYVEHRLKYKLFTMYRGEFSLSYGIELSPHFTI